MTSATANKPNKWIPDVDKGPGWYINPATGRRKFEDLGNRAMNGEMKAVNKALRDAGMPELWSIRVVSGQGADRWAVIPNPDFKTPEISLGIGKDSHWSLPTDLYGLRIPNDPQGLVKNARTAQFTNWLNRADLGALLEKFPEFQPFAAAYAPVAERFLQMRSEQGMPSYLINSRTGQTVTTAEGLLEQWLRMVALQKGHADFGLPVRSVEDIAPYLDLQGGSGLVPFLDHYAQESKTWIRKNMPALLGGLSLLGLSPVAALGKGLGAALGSNIAGQAAAGAAASAALGGDPLRGALPALLGGASDALGAAHNLGAAGPAASQALMAAAQGGDPLAAALASFAQQGAGQTNSTNGGTSNMSGFNLKDILASAAAGALTGGSAPTGAAAAAALQLLNGNPGLLPQNAGGGALASLIQGYAQSKLQGGQGGQGAAQSLGNMLTDRFLAGGTLDDKLRAALGIPDGLGGSLQGLLPQGTGGAIEGALQEWLRNKLYDELNIPRDTAGGAPAPGIQQGAAPPAAAPPAPVDLLSLYQHYHDRLPAPDTGYANALDTMLASAQNALQSQFRDQRQALDADLNRRGLFSSGIALQQQGRLGEQHNTALASAAAQHAMDAYSMQQAGEQSRRDQAWDMARTAASLAAQGGAAPPALQNPAAAQQPALNPLQTLARSILDRVSQPSAPTVLTQQAPVQTGLAALGSALTAPLFTTNASASGRAQTQNAPAQKPRFSFAAPPPAGTASRRFTLSGASAPASGSGKGFKFSYLG